MKVEYVIRVMKGQRVVDPIPGKGEPITVYDILKFPWLPGLIKELQDHEITIRHPQGKAWHVVFQINYQIGQMDRPTGRLLIRPSVCGRLVPCINLSPLRPLTRRIVGRYMARFFREISL